MYLLKCHDITANGRKSLTYRRMDKSRLQSPRGGTTGCANGEIRSPRVQCGLGTCLPPLTQCEKREAFNWPSQAVPRLPSTRCVPPTRSIRPIKISEIIVRADSKVVRDRCVFVRAGKMEYWPRKKREEREQRDSFESPLPLGKGFYRAPNQQVLGVNHILVIPFTSAVFLPAKMLRHSNRLRGRNMP
jgi:hypothetical protein